VLIQTSSGLLVLALLLATTAPKPDAGRTDEDVQVFHSSPVRAGVARSGGLEIRYTIHGESSSGRLPMLVLHGAYMTGDGMRPFVERFAKPRQVIVFDQRGHGRTGDAPGPLTYERLADDAAAVLSAAGIQRADVFGYSMGGSAAIQLAVRHPAKVAKLVAVSAGTRLDAMYPEIVAGIEQITPSTFAGTPIRQEYDRLAPRPQDFPKLVEKLKTLDATQFNWDAAVRSLKHPTMIISGDYDVTRPEHAVEMFRMRGGGAPELAAQGILQAPPPARLMILPATSHIGIVAEAEAIVSFVTPFLDDVTPAAPKGFF
jgi:pimeloyl-ACP methyl ester carboxylesterase